MNKTIKYIKKEKTFLFLPFLLVAVLVISSCSTDENQTVAEFTELEMADEFDTDGPLNNDIWDYEIGTGQNGWGNGELQYYTDRTENITVQNGVLIITAKKEEYNGSSYTSARIVTKGEQAYGRFEARIRVPYGQGMWPAFWLLGADCGPAVVWPQCGEIDIMEYDGKSLPPYTEVYMAMDFQAQMLLQKVIVC